jgi:hypothetical protein
MAMTRGSRNDKAWYYRNHGTMLWYNQQLRESSLDDAKEGWTLVVAMMDDEDEVSSLLVVILGEDEERDLYGDVF